MFAIGNRSWYINQTKLTDKYVNKSPTNHKARYSHRTDATGSYQSSKTTLINYRCNEYPTRAADYLSALDSYLMPNTFGLESNKFNLCKIQN